MVVTVDRTANEPVYEQIARQLRDSIAAGELEVGSRLPSVRTLASDLGVNLNTVARAYRALEDEGFLQVRSRAGAEVAAPPSRTPSAVRRQLSSELQSLIDRMRQAGLGVESIRRAFEAALDARRPGEMSS